MQNTIRLNEVLDKMKEYFPGTTDRVPFDISFCSFDKQRRKGGEWKVMKKMVRCGMTSERERQRLIDIKPMDGTGRPIAVHIRLIEKFNGMEVIY